MFALFCFFQFIPGPPGNHLKLEIQIAAQNFLQCHHLGLLAVNGQHNYAYCFLQLAERIQPVQHHLSIGVPFQFNDNSHSIPVRFIPQIADAVNPFILDQTRNAFNQPRFVYHIGDFCHDDTHAVFMFFYLCLCPQGDFPAAGGISGTNP